MPPKSSKPAPAAKAAATPAAAAAAIPAAAAAVNPNKPKAVEVAVSKINFRPQMQAFAEQQRKNALRFGLEEGKRIAEEKAARKAHNRELNRINEEKAAARKLAAAASSTHEAVCSIH